MTDYPRTPRNERAPPAMTRRMVTPRRSGRTKSSLLSVVSLVFMLDAGRVALADPIPWGRPLAPLPPSILSTDTRSETLHRDFEAVALQALLAPMLSQDRSGAYGAGAAGKHWQAMMTEHIAKQMAASGRMRLSAPSRPARPKPLAASLAIGAAGAAEIPCRGSGCAAGHAWTTTVMVASDDAATDPGTTGWQTRIIDGGPQTCTPL